MNTAMQRRDFLRGNLSGRRTRPRPPWATPEPRFTALCSRCGDCLAACPTGILRVGSGGFPEVDFGHGECLFCADCVDSCTTGALLQRPGQIPWTIRAVLDEATCLAFRGVECRACADPCPVRAIRIRPRVGGPARPDIDPDDCNGCGACVAPCPLTAIRIQPSGGRTTHAEKTP